MSEQTAHRAFTLAGSYTCTCRKGTDHALILPGGDFPEGRDAARRRVRELEEN